MNRAQRAVQLWSLLVVSAIRRQVLTYGLIAKVTGVVRPSIGDFLRPIQQYCTENSLPPLTSLVISEQTGLPGEGFIAASDVPLTQVRVFQFNWLNTRAPTEEQLADSYTRAPDAR